LAMGELLAIRLHEGIVGNVGIVGILGRGV
jgi:hypothetical protein